MPDADDFDVEYFRNLMKGSNPKEPQAAPDPPPTPAAKNDTRQTTKAPVTKGVNTPAAGRKKPAPGTKSGRKKGAPGR